MLPFSHDQFFEVFAAYNGALWPLAGLAAVISWHTCSEKRRRRALDPVGHEKTD